MRRTSGPRHGRCEEEKAQKKQEKSETREKTKRTEEVVIDLRKHVATVPNGFARYFVLKVLTEKPMSGSQIIAEIEEKTNGAWKPSFGSVYGVLSQLKQDDYIVEMPTEDPYLKPYSLTEEGEKLLQDLKKTIAERLRRFESVVRVLCPEILFLGSD